MSKLVGCRIGVGLAVRGLILALVVGPTGCGGRAPISPTKDGGGVDLGGDIRADVGADSNDAIADTAVDDSATADAADAGVDAGRIVFQIPANRDLDLLFLVDDSPGMAPLQAKFRAGLPAFISALSGLPGGLPNLHLAVVSSSLGAGIYRNVTGCTPATIGNLNGAFQHKAACTGLPAGQRFVKSIAGVNNFTGNLADVLGCIADLGEGGCGLEHQFESVRLALQRAQTPSDPENAGFLRPNAHLAIVMLTNEDDCSVPADSMLFDPNQQTLADPLGGLQSYRCNEFGHKCGPAPGAKPPHRVTTSTTLDSCVSAEDGVLVTVDGFVKFIRSLKPGSNQISVAALAGPSAPYAVSSRSFQLMTGAMEVQPQMVPSCTQATAAGAPPEVGYPGVRIKQWLDAFGSNGALQSICMAEFAPALTRIASVIGNALNGVNCVPGVVLSNPDGTPDCRIVETSRNAAGGLVDVTVPFCSGGRLVVPCWEFSAPPECPGGQRFHICRDVGCTTSAVPTDPRTVELSCSFAP